MKTIRSIRTLKSILGGLGAVLLSVGVASAQETSDQLELSRELLNKYYEMEQVLGKERADWKLGKELLQSRVDLMEAQLKELRTKTEEEEGKITSTDNERTELDAENTSLQKVQDRMVEAVEIMEGRVRKIWPLLPGLLQTKVQGQFDRLPAPSLKREDIKSSVGERFLSVLAILNEITKFHSDITVVNERRKLDSGKELEVETIYFGLSVAYFAGSDPEDPVAGMLVPGEEGWTTVEKPEIQQSVLDVIAMNKSEMVAGFVPLPVDVR